MNRTPDGLRDLRALVVDDEPLTRLMASECLKRDGFMVSEADSGDKAIDIICCDRPGIVLLDVLMPGLDGFEVCSRIRREAKTLDLPVLMMTGLDDEESIKRAFEAGATDFITKPINWDLLAYRVRYILRAASTLEKLCEVEDRSSAIVHALPDMLSIVNKDGLITDVTHREAAADLLPPDDPVIGKNLLDVLPREIAVTALHNIDAAIDTGKVQVFEYMLRADGRGRYFEARVKSFGSDTALVLIRNITERKEYDNRLKGYQHELEELVAKRTCELTDTIMQLEAEVEQKKRIAEELSMLDKAAKTTMTGITITDLHRKIIYINQAEAEMHGYDAEELLHKDVYLFAPPELISPMDMDQINSATTWCRESINIRKDGTRFPVKLVSDIVRDDEGSAVGIVTTCEDITVRKEAERELKEYHDHLEQLVELRTNDLNDTVIKLTHEVDNRKKQEEKITYLAYHDSLTGLPNRTLFSNRLWNELGKAKSEGQAIALMYIDLDNFKNINDTLGHTIGDFILCEVGKRLSRVVRKEDSLLVNPAETGSSIVSRLGGDEFILLLSDISSIRDVEKVADRILDSMSVPINLDCHEIFITPSIGIALYPEHGYDADTLLMNADTAMYNAKSDGKNTFRFYSSSMSEESMRRLMLENDLHRALDRDELLVYYQPQYDVKTGRITCLEALLRWEHRQHGMIMPDVFIPIAEQHGLIVPIGQRVIRKVCEQITAWRKKNIDPARVAINVSGRQFQSNFSGIVGRLLKESGVQPKMIEVEITESSVMRDPGNTIKILSELKALGVSVAIDDFGTGYSSLNYLSKFPIDALKVDRSFVSEIFRNNDNDMIIKAIIAMAHSMNLKVVAEGVESEQQSIFLRENDCDRVQGYYYSKPLNAADIEFVLMDGDRKCA